MRTRHLFIVLVLLALALPAPSVQEGGVVTVCDEAHLLAALAGGGTVTFACSGTIVLTNTIMVSADTTIDGSGQSVTISGNNAVQVFRVDSGIALNLNGLTVARGNTIGGSGGIANYGILTINNSTLVDHHAWSGGGAIGNHHGRVAVSKCTFVSNGVSLGSGGAIYNDNGEVTISHCTFDSNGSRSGGGGISSYGGTLTVSNCTFHRNSTWGGGGGIYNSDNGTVTVSNSTFSDHVAHIGGGIGNDSGTVTLKNTIFANNLTGGNCAGTITDGGGNLSYPDTTCPGLNADPLLGSLQNNGGPTLTMEPGLGSAAIDAGIDAICAAPPVNNLDQRGITRPAGAHCDIGAVERLPFRYWLPTVLRR